MERCPVEEDAHDHCFWEESRVCQACQGMIVPFEGEILYVGGLWPYGVMEDGVLEGRDPSLRIALILGYAHQ